MVEPKPFFIFDERAWLEKWEDMKDKKHGLSAETFMTCKQTTKGLIGLAIYLLEEKGFSYVCFGFITSDPIERRFGWYRLLGGANYYLSVRQFLESEKKIRLQCLIKFSKLSFKTVIDALLGLVMCTFTLQISI